MSFELGDAFQFDWSCEYVFVGGLRRRLDAESTALFGLGFQGATRSGYTIMVPTEVLDEAQAQQQKGEVAPALARHS